MFYDCFSGLQISDLIPVNYFRAEVGTGRNVRQCEVFGWTVDVGVFATPEAATINAMGDAVTAPVQAGRGDEDAPTTVTFAAKDQVTLGAINIE